MIPMRRFLLTCLLFLVSSLVFAQQTPEEQLVIQYYKDGEYEKASKQRKKQTSIKTITKKKKNNMK